MNTSYSKPSLKYSPDIIGSYIKECFCILWGVGMNNDVLLQSRYNHDVMYSLR